MRSLVSVGILSSFLISAVVARQYGASSSHSSYPLRTLTLEATDGPVRARDAAAAESVSIAVGRHSFLVLLGDALWVIPKDEEADAMAFSFASLVAELDGCDVIEPLAVAFDSSAGQLGAFAMGGDPGTVCALLVSEAEAVRWNAWKRSRLALDDELSELIHQVRASEEGGQPLQPRGPALWARAMDPDGRHEWVLVGSPEQPLQLVKLLAGSTIFADDFESGDFSAWSDVSGANQPPILDPIGARTVTVGQSLAFRLTASDPDEQTIYFGALPLPLPVGASLDAASGQFSFTPGLEHVGTVTLTFFASDGAATSSEVVTITVVGPAVGDPTAISGRILDANDYELGITTPIVGATVRVLGDTASAISAADGSFLLSDLPSGTQVFDIDTGTASAAPNGAPYAGFREALTLLPGVTHDVERPFFLPRIATESLTTVDPTTTTTVENPTLGVTLEVPANSAKNPDGSDFTGQLSISLVPQNLAPVALPETLAPSFLLTFQPVGVRFTQPALLTIPNVDGLGASTEADIWSLDEASGSFGVVGTGTVRADASAVDTTSGGIVSASWHAILPPRLVPDDRNQNDENLDPTMCDDCESGSVTAVSSGNLTVTHDLVPYRSNDVVRGLRLVYTSETADPRPVVSSLTTILQLSAIPDLISSRLTLGGIDQGAATFSETSSVASVQEPVLRLAAQGRAGELATGLVPYRLALTSHFGEAAITGIQAGSVFVHNRRSSSLGAGWGIDGLQRLQPIPDTGTLLVTNGNGAIQRFVPTANGPGTTVLVDPFDDENGGNGVGTYSSFTNWNVVDFYGNASSALLVGNGVQDAWPDNGLYVGMDVDPGGIDSVELESKTAYNFSVGVYEMRLRVATPLTTSRTSEVIVGLGGPSFPLDLGDLFLATFAPGEVSSFQEISCLIEVVAQPSAQSIPKITPGSLPGVPAGCVVEMAPTTAPISIRKPEGNDGVPIGGLYIDDVRLISYGDVDAAFAGPAGDTSTIVYDETSDTHTRIEKDGSRRAFDTDGRQVSWIDRNGQTTTYTYEADDRLATITDPAQRVTTFSYDGGLLESITDPAGRITSFAHDPQSNLTSITDPDDSVRSFRYDLDHRITQQTSPRDFDTNYFYNFAGQNDLVIRPDSTERHIAPLAALALGDPANGIGTEANPIPVVRADFAYAAFTDGRNHTTRFKTNRFGSIGERIDALGNPSTTEYDANGRPTSIVSPEGIRTELEYDTRLNLRKVREAVGTPFERETELIYEPNLNLVERAIDPSGAEAIFEYHPDTGNLEIYTDAEGHQRVFTWDAEGRLETSKDPRDNLTTFRYGPYGNLEEIEDATNRVTRFGRDAAGNVISVTEAYGMPAARTWLRGYDEMNRLTSITDPASQTTVFEYDEAGNITSVTRPSNLVTSATYDEENRLATLTTPQTGTATFVYDDAGNLETVTDALDRTTTYVYDALDRRVQTVDALGGISTTVYGDDGRVESFENARGKITSFVYDELNRLRTRTNPELDQVTFTYDEPRDLVKTYTDAEDQIITHVYDKLGRRTSTTTSDDTISFEFDAAGNLERAADGDSELVYTFDALNRLATETITLNGATPVVLTHAYDPAYGNRESVTDSLGGVTLFDYDAANRVDSVTSAAGPQVSMGWDGDGRLTSVSRPNGVSSTYTYDPARGVLDTLTLADASSTLLQASYEFDVDGRVDTITEGGQIRSFEYDLLGRVTDAGTSGLPETYAYDSIGNRTSSHLSASYSHDEADRLTSEASHTYTYDQNGSLRTATETATSDVTTYGYDALDRLTNVDLPGGGSASYRYDALGRRFEKTVDGTVTRYLYDGADILLEQDATEAVTARYAHGPLVDQPLAMTRGGTDAFYLADHQGSIRFLVDGVGSTLNQYAYDAFGRSLVATEGIQNPYTYTAREQDPETGHLHYRARAYDPNLGRFLASDPIGFAGGDANLYAYVGNDPANFSDPSGLLTPWDAVDVVSFFISLNDFRNCPGFATGFFVLADLAGAAIPVLPGLGTLRHAANLADGAVDAVNAADNLGDGARGASNLAGGLRNAGDEFVDLASPQRRRHILDGDGTGGGHRAGTGFPNKSEFPASMSDDQIMHHISDIATDPAATRRSGRNGRSLVEGTREGVDFLVVQEGNGAIVTAFPTNVPRNPR